MVGEDDKDRLAGSTRKTYLRSVSWTDRSPSKPNLRPQPNSKTRPCLPPLQPLSIARRPVEEWPRAGSDDIGVWPNPQTPRGSGKPLESPGSEKPFREFQFKDKLAFFNKECSRIADHIYLGSDAVAKNREILRRNGITHVLNCVGFVCPEYFKSDLVYKTLWLQDSPSEDITSILYDVFDYFEDVREQGGRVFVHCCQGVSRSTSLVIAYLMWREGQSFEDAFQYVKAARGVTNPNMGFACQLLQCQKRVHAVPASPNSVLRMYRMAPHSSYDPLHLVPKMLSDPNARNLDSRGAFIVHVPSAIYIWIGKNCNSVMLNNARVAANQVVRYERAQGPIMNIKEGEEPSEFWDALAGGQFLAADGCSRVDLKKEEYLSPRKDEVVEAVQIAFGERKVAEYDMDFEIFQKALAGGVVPPSSVSSTGSETCLPARESGWGRLREKLASGIMKGFVNSSKMGCDTIPSSSSDMIVDICEVSQPPSVDSSSPSSPSAYACGSPDSFDCFPNSSPDRIRNSCEGVEPSGSPTDPLSPPTPSCGSPDSFSSFLDNRMIFSSKSPTVSPSTSDYASSFSFSPSSSNWSDLSCLSSRQPSPSGMEAKDPFSGNKVSLADNSSLLKKETHALATKEFASGHTLRSANTCLPCKVTSISIAERRGSNPPPRMMLPSVDEASQVPRNLVRSWSFSLPVVSDAMNNMDCDQFEQDGNREEPMLDSDGVSASNHSDIGVKGNEACGEFHLSSGEGIDKVAEVTTPSLYQWPTWNEVEMHGFHILDSRSAYILLAPNLSPCANNNIVLYVWLGCDFLREKGQSKWISHDGPHQGTDLHWEMIGYNFINHIGLPAKPSIQIIREGEEPEQFRSHLFSFQKGLQ